MGEPGGLLSMGSRSWTRLKRLSSSSSSKLISFPSEPSVKIYIYSRAYISCFLLIVCLLYQNIRAVRAKALSGLEVSKPGSLGVLDIVSD